MADASILSQIKGAWLKRKGRSEEPSSRIPAASALHAADRDATLNPYPETISGDNQCLCARPVSRPRCCLLRRQAVWSQATPTAPAVHWPTVDGTVTLQNFRFGTGETLPELKLHYLTLGTPHRNAAGRTDNAVLLLHGTGGNAHSLMNPLFSDVLFAPGGVLDIRKYFIILPDDIGHGESSKPSDGLHAHFPAYDYDDMVRSQHMMLDDDEDRSSAADPRHLNGLHADLRLGRDLSRASPMLSRRLRACPYRSRAAIA